MSIPGDGSVTGQVFNSTSAFDGNRFLFVSEDGTISGWKGGTTALILQLPSDAYYKGAALVTNGSDSYLLAANFHSGNIDVLKGSSSSPDLAGKFTDPAIPNGYAPFNIQLLGGKIYVSYALQGSGKDEQAGPGLGFVSVFDTQGTFIGRVASQWDPERALGAGHRTEFIWRVCRRPARRQLRRWHDQRVQSRNGQIRRAVAGNGRETTRHRRPLGAHSGQRYNGGKHGQALLFRRPARRVERAFWRDHCGPRAKFCSPRTHRRGSSHRGTDRRQKKRTRTAMPFRPVEMASTDRDGDF